MARWTRILAAAAARMQCRPAPRRSSTVAPQPIPSFAPALKGGRLPPSNGSAPMPHWFASLLAKMRRARATCSPSADGKRASKGAGRSSAIISNSKKVPRSRSPRTKIVDDRGPASATTSFAESKRAPAATSSDEPKLGLGATTPATSSADTRVSPFLSTTLKATAVPASEGGGPLPPPPPPPSLPRCSRGHEDDRRDRFNEYLYKVTAFGGAVIAFLYGELKAKIEKDVDNKVKKKELKDKDRILSEKQDEISRKDIEIQTLKAKLQEKGKSWFF